MELCQPEAAVAYMERVTFREVKLDGVAVVDDRVGPLAPTELERRLAGPTSSSNIDGRLLVTCRARRCRDHPTCRARFPPYSSNDGFPRQSRSKHTAGTAQGQ